MVRSKEAKARRKAKLKARQKEQAAQQGQAKSTAPPEKVTEPVTASPKKKKKRKKPKQTQTQTQPSTAPAVAVAKTLESGNLLKKKKKKKKKKKPAPVVIPEPPQEDLTIRGKRKRKRKKQKKKPKPAEEVAKEDEGSGDEEANENENENEDSSEEKSANGTRSNGLFGLVNRYSKKAQTSTTSSKGASTGSDEGSRGEPDSAGFELGSAQVLRRLRKRNLNKHTDATESDEDFDLSKAKTGTIASLDHVIEERKSNGEKEDRSIEDDKEEEDSSSKRPRKKARSGSNPKQAKVSKKRKRPRTEEVQEASTLSTFQKISSFISPMKPRSLKPLPMLDSGSESDGDGRTSTPPLLQSEQGNNVQQPTFPTSQYDYEEDAPSEKALKAASKVRDLLRKRKEESNGARDETVSAKRKAVSSSKADKDADEDEDKEQGQDKVESGSTNAKRVEEEESTGSEDCLFLPPSELQTSRGKPKTDKKKGKTKAPTVVCRPPWLLHANVERTPKHGHLWLHNEIMHFVQFLDNTDFEKPSRDKTIKFVTDLVAKLWPHAEARVFGSVTNHLVIPGSDIDMVVLNAPSRAIHILANALRDGDQCEMIQVIVKTKVPVIKMRMKGTPHMADISFEHIGGLETGVFVRGLLQNIPQLRPLTMVIKYFLKQRGLNDPFHGGLGSHQCLLTVVSMLQHVRRRLIGSTASGSDLPAPIESFEDLGSLLVEYFKLYGIDFNYATTAVKLRSGGFYEKQGRRIIHKSRGGYFSMENPEDPSHDLGATAWKMGPIRRAFSLAARSLAIKLYKHRRYPGQNSKSILASVITVDKKLQQRYDHMHDLDVDMSED